MRKEEIGNELVVEYSASAFDLTRLGTDAIYSAVEDRYCLNTGRSINIKNMTMKPIGFNEDEVLYHCIIDDYEFEE